MVFCRNDTLLILTTASCFPEFSGVSLQMRELCCLAKINNQETAGGCYKWSVFIQLTTSVILKKDTNILHKMI